MKLHQISLVIMGSIITFIGLVLNKIYETYIKNNKVIQIAIYLFFTLVTLRILYWIAKPFLDWLIPLKLTLANVNITFTADPSIGLSIILLIFTIILAMVIKSWIQQIDQK